MPDPTVEQLFATWRATGDPAALAAVYERTAVGLLVVARHLCGDVHAAEDVVQATFLAALRHAERYDASRPLRPWLTGILGHEVRRRRRDERRRVDPERLPVRTAHDPAAAAQSSELTRAVDEAIDRLPPIYRSVLVLKLAHGFTAAEIAHALRRPPGTVRAQLARGTELLAKALPAGLATALAIVATPGRGLAAVRDVVLAAAARSAPTAGALTFPASTSLTFGAMVMGKKLALVAGTAALLGLSAYALWPSRAPVVATPSHAAETASAANVDVVPPSNVRDVDVLARVASPDTPPPVAATPTATSLRVTVRYADGSAAPGVAVVCEPAPRRDWFAMRDAQTDAGGVATFDGLDAPAVDVVTRLGGSTRAALTAGAANAVELTIPAGVDVQGVVVDPSGTPVARAVVVGGRADDLLFEPLTTCDGYGRFALRSVDPTLLLGATAEGRLPSRVTRSRTLERTQRLEVGAADSAGTIFGRVTGADGQPLAGAWVRIGGDSDQSVAAVDQADSGKRSSLSMAMVPVATPRVRSDRNGDFVVAGVRAGPLVVLSVGASGHENRRVVVAMTAAAKVRCDVALAAQAQLRGRVLRADGSPPQSPRFTVVDATAPPRDLADTRPNWLRPRTRVNPDGTFVCDNLPAGLTRVFVEDADGAAASTEFDVRAGEVKTWDAELRALGTITGTLTGPDGRPLVGWHVRAETRLGVGDPVSNPTDAEGAFTVRQCLPAPHDLRCFDPSSTWNGPLHLVRGVMPDGAPLAIQLGAGDSPSATITGRIVGARFPTGTRFSLLVTDGDRGSATSQSVADAKRSGPSPQRTSSGMLTVGSPFSFGPLPARVVSLALHATSPGLVQIPLGVHRLHPAQTLDLGNIEVPLPGRLVVLAEDAAGTPIDVYAAFRPMQMGRFGIGVRLSGGRGTLDCPPGTYLPAGALPNGFEHPAFEVRSGETTEVRLVRREQRQRKLRIDVTAPGVMRQFRLTFVRAGTAVAQAWVEAWRDEPLELDHWFSVGAWEVELEFLDGTTHRTSFAVDASTQAPVIEVRVPGR